MGSSTAAPQPSPSTSTPAASSSFYPREDCSQGICSSSCPQFCPANNYYYLGPPPPPLLYADDSSDSSRVSPLMIALISVLAAAFLLLSYYTFASRCCKRRRSRWSRNDDDDELQLQTRLDQLVLRESSGATSVQLPAVNSDGGLDEQFIRSITVFKYNKGDGLVESTDCAVCLTEFQETESLRLMPNCQHAFHPPCIDTWLRSHSNCPICRSSMIGAPPPPPPLPARRQPPPVVSRMRVHRGGDVVVVVDAAARDQVREIGGLDLRRQVSPAEEVDLTTAVVGKERRGDEQFNH